MSRWARSGAWRNIQLWYCDDVKFIAVSLLLINLECFVFKFDILTFTFQFNNVECPVFSWTIGLKFEAWLCHSRSILPDEKTFSFAKSRPNRNLNSVCTFTKSEGCSSCSRNRNYYKSTRRSHNNCYLVFWMLGSLATWGWTQTFGV